MGMDDRRFLEPFDLDLELRDAATDPDLSPTRRMIANAAIGMPADDAYFTVRELREVVGEVHEGELGSKRRLTATLANPDGDDFVRCLYYCLAGRGVVAMMDDLSWLEDLLERRGRTAGEMQRRKVGLMVLASPYVADEPDGPMVALNDFELGRSWWADPAS